jgi:hypothetical protein
VDPRFQVQSPSSASRQPLVSTFFSYPRAKLAKSLVLVTTVLHRIYNVVARPTPDSRLVVMFPGKKKKKPPFYIRVLRPLSFIATYPTFLRSDKDSIYELTCYIDRRISPTLELATNNPFRARLSSAPLSPDFPPSTTTRERPQSRNPFLDVFDEDQKKADFNFETGSSKPYQKSNSFDTSTQRPALNGSAAELFVWLYSSSPTQCAITYIYTLRCLGKPHTQQPTVC